MKDEMRQYNEDLLIIGDEISKQTIVYGTQQLGKIYEFLKEQIRDRRKSAILIKSKTKNRYFLMYQFNINEPSNLKNLQKIVNLGDNILSIGLSNEIQSLIQKIYLNMLDHVYRVDIDRKISLTFIKQLHKNSSTFKDKIKYCKQLSQQCFHKQKNQDLITVEQLQNIYNFCVDPKKYNVCKVKLTYENMKKLKRSQDKFSIANELIFNNQRDRKLIDRDINRMKLPKNIYESLMWKSKQVEGFNEMIKEKRNNNSEYYRQLTFDALLFDIVNSGIILLSKRWTKNSLVRLKQIFNKIANRNDHKAIEQFQKVSQNYLERLQEIQKIYKNEHKSKLEENKIQIIYLRQMITQLKQFINAHQTIIKNQFLSTFKYFKHAVRYYWRHNRIVYQKIAIIILIIILALLQNDFIKTVSIVCLGLIFLSIKM